MYRLQIWSGYKWETVEIGPLDVIIENFEYKTCNSICDYIITDSNGIVIHTYSGISEVAVDWLREGF